MHDECLQRVLVDVDAETRHRGRHEALRSQRPMRPDRRAHACAPGPAGTRTATHSGARRRSGAWPPASRRARRPCAASPRCRGRRPPRRCGRPSRTPCGRCPAAARRPRAASSHAATCRSVRKCSPSAMRVPGRRCSAAWPARSSGSIGHSSHCAPCAPKAALARAAVAGWSYVHSASTAHQSISGTASRSAANSSRSASRSPRRKSFTAREPSALHSPQQFDALRPRRRARAGQIARQCRRRAVGEERAHRTARAPGQRVVQRDVERRHRVLVVAGEVAAAALRIVEGVDERGDRGERASLDHVRHETAHQRADHLGRDRTRRLAPADVPSARRTRTSADSTSRA